MDPPGRSTSNNKSSTNNSSSSPGRSPRRKKKNWEKYACIVILLQSIAIIAVFEKFQLPNVVQDTVMYGQEDIRTAKNHAKTQHHPNDDPKNDALNNNGIAISGIQEHPLPFSFSACLLIKDNNILLPEWLAYHYTILPLRRLIVGVDPMSHTDPQPIFDAYASIGMNITTWRNDSFWVDGYNGPHEKKDFPITDKTGTETLRLRRDHRQNVFYKSCMQQLKDENQTWTVLIDTDEYLAFNHYDEQEGPPTWCSRKGQKPSCGEDYAKSIKDGTHPRSKLDRSPTATVAQHIDKHGVDINWDGVDKPCIIFGRYLFVSKESSSREEIQRGLDSDFNATFFHTLRYRYRAPLSTYQLGKSIVDVSRYDEKEIPRNPNPHRPLGNLCTG